MIILRTYKITPKTYKYKKNFFLKIQDLTIIEFETSKIRWNRDREIQKFENLMTQESRKRKKI